MALVKMKRLDSAACGEEITIAWQLPLYFFLAGACSATSRRWSSSTVLRQGVGHHEEHLHVAGAAHRGVKEIELTHQDKGLKVLFYPLNLF